jgi:ribA/ribD-fused uncharacterized protein
MADTIKFYGRSGPCFEFSNFARYPIMIDGRVWKTSEHYYQAMKFDGNDEHVNVIFRAKSPMEAATKGREHHRPLRDDWDEVKDDVMYKALVAKFTQHKYLREVLLGTGDAILIEHTRNDSYWGDGGDGTGKNMLGILLMKLREELRNGER